MNLYKCRERGYILLPVVLLLSLVAAVAWMLNSESGLEGNITASAGETAQVRYVAEAGLNHTLAQITQAGCGPYADISGETFGNNTYSSTITTNNTGGNLTTITVPVIEDAYISENSSTTNFGSAAQLESYYEFTFPFTFSSRRRPLYRFDIENVGIPAGTTIISAVFKVFVISPDSGSVKLHRVTEDWSESTVTYASFDGGGGGGYDWSSSATIPGGPPAGQFVDLNITPLVQSWINGSVNNQGVVLLAQLPNNTSQYSSREYGNVSQRPVLEITVSDGSLSDRATIQSTGTLADGTSRTISRNDVMLYQNPPSTLQLQPDGVEGEDTEIWDQAPNNNYGNVAETWVSSATNDTTRSLLRFNMGAVPYGARILEVTLSMERQSGSGADQPVSAHRIRNPWSEDAVTWNDRESSTAWDTAGGDFDSTAVATTPVGPANQRYDWDITSLAQGWVDGSYPNYGVILAAAIPGMAGERFYTSDHADSNRWPRLDITYACECGTICTAPQGSGNILLVVGDDVTLDENDVKKMSLFEAWGYIVNLINDDSDQPTFDTALGNNDVAYISETVWGPTLASKLADTDKGVVNEEYDQNNRLGLSSSGANAVGDSLTVIDNSHYITALFPSGVQPIYLAPMEATLVTGTPAPSLQTLGDFTGVASLALVDSGGTLEGGGTAAGRRVTIPVGSADKFNWDYLNNNGRLIVQRAIQWGTGNTGGFCVTGNFRDDFETAAFNNNTGSLIWSGDWIEIDSAGSGPSSGKVVITGGEFRINGTASFTGDPSAAREVDLSGHLSASLTFDYRTGSGVEPGEDSVVVEVSSNGGAGWTVLEDFINEPASASGSRSYDISDYLATNTQVRFRINAAYGGPSEYFYVDNLEIAAGCTAPPPPTGPIAHWKLDETGGTTAVDSEGGHDGTLVDDAAWTSGEDGGAVALDGSNDFIDVPYDAELSLVQEMTFTAWVNAENISSDYRAILSQDVPGNGNSNYWFGTWQGELVFGFWASGAFRTIQSSGLNLLENTWYHLTATFDNATDQVFLYVDGTQVQAGSMTFEPTAETANIMIGNSVDNEEWRGKLDDVRIYDRVLPASEIADIVAGGGGGGGDYLDQFNAVAYDGSDGTLDWTGTPWQEVNDDNAAASGNIRVDTNLLHMDNLDGGSLEAIERQADLSGATTAALTFDYTGFGEGGLDIVAVEASGDGGGAWVTLENIEIVGTVSGNKSYNLHDFVALNTDFVLRFRVVQGLAATTQHITIDNARINLDAGGGGGGGGGCSGTVADDFETGDYSGSTGMLTWSGPWLEVNESDGFSSGDERVQSESGDLALRVRDNDGGGEGVEREADLSGYSSGTLNLEYRRHNLDDTDDYVAIEVWNTGTSSWDELDRAAGGGSDTDYQAKSYNISAYLGASTRIRFITSSSMGGTDSVYFDNVEICVNN